MGQALTGSRLLGERPGSCRSCLKSASSSLPASQAWRVEKLGGKERRGKRTEDHRSIYWMDHPLAHQVDHSHENAMLHRQIVQPSCFCATTRAGHALG
jgi:hypothetical protein